MPIPMRKQNGISMMEMMIVLAIIAILAVASVTMIGNRSAAAVRAVLDEVEGTLSIAHGAAVATGRDVAVVTWGSWTNQPLVVAYGDAAMLDADIQSTATKLLAGQAVDNTLLYVNTVAVPFHPTLTDTTYSRARIPMQNDTDWATAMTATSTGATNQDITTVVPFKAGSTMDTLLGDATNYIFANDIHRVVISGSNKRFTSNVVIPVVGITSNGLAITGGPMGLIVVQNNGASIYKFYNPGVREGDGKWRRI